MSDTLRKLRIFLASPSDVASERAKVQTVVAALKPTADYIGVTLEVVGWEQAVPDMMRPQDAIFDHLKPTSWDVFIGILWHRFGTPTGATNAQSGKDYLSGTEEEFKTAYGLWKQYGKPRIMMYRCSRQVDLNAIDFDQAKRVKEFFDQFDAVKGEHPGLYETFDTTETFEKLLLDHLQKLLVAYSKEEKKQPLPQQILNEITPPMPRMIQPPTETPVSATIYAGSDSSEFTRHFERLLQEAKSIIMIGTGLNIISQSDDRRIMLAERAKTDAYIEIYAANPFSPNVQTRLIEEETGDPPPRMGKKGLVDWLKYLLEVREKLVDKSRLVLRLFPLYPTYALFIFDERDYFFYPYGYAKLGTLSPVIHYSIDNQPSKWIVKFFQGQYEQVKNRSAEADLIFKLDRHEDVKPNQLTAFAVYLVPPANSDLYKFGSHVLEYEVRTGQVLPSGKWHNAIGAAADFGFHLTVADALYCASAKDLDLISKEVEFAAQRFRPFTLSFSIEKDFPDSKGIALVCQDKSGSLEALHHEMVARVYRNAAASNYTLGIAQPDRDQDRERADLMIDHYYAPYILQRFKPHFSLLSNVPAERKDLIYRDIQRLFEKRVVETSIDIRKIAVMHRPDQSKRWQIRDEYDIGGAKP